VECYEWGLLNGVGVSQFDTSKSGVSVPRILVADDNSNIQKMVALAFQDHGIEVIAVGNGEAAVRRIPDINPDVVLADVFMPVRNGYEVCEFVKKDPRFAKVPVILLVGAFDPLDEAEARRVGADGILKKPFVPPDPLIAMVTSVMAKAPKPEPKAEAPALEIPKPPPPPPPPMLSPFLEPTPEEEAYAFGTGRRSLDDDDAPAGSGHSAKFAVTPAAAASTGTIESAAEEDAGFSETSVDWRRRDQVNSSEVPSFSAALFDEPAAQSASESSNETESLAAGNAPDSPVLTEEPSPELPSSASFMRAFEGAFAEPAQAEVDQTPVEQAPVEQASADQNHAESVEQAAPPPTWEKPLEESFQSTKGFTDLIEPAFANPRDWKLSESADVAPVELGTVETAPSVAVENAQAEVHAAPVVEPVAPGAAPEFSWRGVVPPPILAVEVPEPESFACAPASAESAAQSTLEAIQFPPESVAVETPSQVSEAAPVEPSAFGASRVEASPSIETSATSAAEFESVARVEETEEPEPLASPVAILESTEIAAREIGSIPLVSAPVAASEVASFDAPAVEAVAAPTEPPEPTPIAAAPHVEVAPLPAQPIAEHAASPEFSSVSAQPDSQMLPVEAVPEPAASSADPIETVASVAPAPASPSVDELVARVLEKLGPQLQELLSKNLVRPMVEDLLHKPDADKK
jgi:CheY-like chemotaxis protein